MRQFPSAASKSSGVRMRCNWKMESPQSAFLSASHSFWSADEYTESHWMPDWHQLTNSRITQITNPSALMYRLRGCTMCHFPSLSPNTNWQIKARGLERGGFWSPTSSHWNPGVMLHEQNRPFSQMSRYSQNIILYCKTDRCMISIYATSVITYHNKLNSLIFYGTSVFFYND